MEILNTKRWKLLFSPSIHLFIPLFVNFLLGAFLRSPDTTLRRPRPMVFTCRCSTYKAHSRALVNSMSTPVSGNNSDYPSSYLSSLSTGQSVTESILPWTQSWYMLVNKRIFKRLNFASVFNFVAQSKVWLNSNRHETWSSIRWYFRKERIKKSFFGVRTGSLTIVEGMANISQAAGTAWSKAEKRWTRNSVSRELTGLIFIFNFFIYLCVRISESVNVHTYTLIPMYTKDIRSLRADI